MEEIELKEIMEFVKGKWWMIVITVVVFAIIGVVYSKVLVTPLYEASTSIILIKNDFENEAEVSAYAKKTDSYSVVAGSRKVAQKAIENLKIETSLGDVQENVEIIAIPYSQNIRIIVKNKSYKEAAKISDEIAKVTLEEVKEIYNDENIKILDYAVEDNTPVNIDVAKNVCTCVFIGLIFIFVVLIYAFFKNNDLKQNDTKK